MVLGLIALAWLLAIVAFAMAWSCFCYHCSDIRTAELRVVDDGDESVATLERDDILSRRAA